MRYGLQQGWNGRERAPQPDFGECRYFHIMIKSPAKIPFFAHSGKAKWSQTPEHGGRLTDLEVGKDLFLRRLAGDDLYLRWQFILILLSNGDIHSR